MSPSEASSSRPTLASAESAFSFETADLIEILEDLSTRFILNLPESESESIPRLCFQVEQAYWFYEDWVRDSQPNLPSYTLKRFSEIFFKVCPMLSKWSDKHERLFLEFMRYKTRVPVCGAVMINETWDKCVLVKGWKGNSWSFPKGKINQEEEKHICAIREVLEETGCDLINLLKTDVEYFHETTIQDQRITLYFVPGVPEDFFFETQTRKEIGAIEWFKLSDLPTWKKTKTTSTPKLAGKGKFYMILPFILELKKFVKSHRPSSLKHSSSPLPTPISESALPTPLDEDPPSETEVSSTPILPDSPAQLREAPVPLSELDELFARFLSSSEREDRSRSASAVPRMDQDIEEEEDENEGTVMGGSDEVEQKPPTTSILDQMFGALTLPSAPPPPSPSNQFSPPPQANYPHPPQHLSQPQPQHASSLLSLFSNLPPPPPQQQVFQSRPPPNASLLALLNPSNPSPALYNSSPMYHHSRPSAPPTSSTSSIPQPNQPNLTNDKQSLLAMFSPPPSRSVPEVPSSSMPSNGQDQSEEARKKKKQMALLAMMDASLGGAGAGIGGGGPPPPGMMFNSGQSPMFQQQQPIYNQQPSPYVAQQLPMMPPNPHQSPFATNFPPRPPPLNLNGGPPYPLNLNGPPPPPFSNQQQQLDGHSPFQPHPQSSFGGFPGGGGQNQQSPRMMNFNNGGPPPPLPLGPGAPGPGAFHNGVPSYPGQMPNGFRGQPGGPGRAPLLPPSNFPPPGSNANSNGPPPPPSFLVNPNPLSFQSPQRQQPQPQPYRGQPSLPPSSSSTNFPPLPSSTNFPPLPSSINKNDPFTVNPMLQQQTIISPGSRPNNANGSQQQQQVPVPIHHPKPQGMTNHAECLLGMLKGGGGGGKVASVNMPGYPSGSPAVGR